MTVARNNTEPALGETASPLAARLELLIRRGITVDQFEADMVRTMSLLGVTSIDQLDCSLLDLGRTA